METPETDTEKGRTKTKTMMTIEGNGFVETMSSRFDYWRMIRVTSWILRFKNNCTGEKQVGPITAAETSQSERVWFRLVQKGELDPGALGPTIDDQGFTLIKGRIPV